MTYYASFLKHRLCTIVKNLRCHKLLIVKIPFKDAAHVNARTVSLLEFKEFLSGEFLNSQTGGIPKLSLALGHLKIPLKYKGVRISEFSHK